MPYEKEKISPTHTHSNYYYEVNKVVEVDANKNIIWEFGNVNALNADRLSNGNTLIADKYPNKRIIEVTPQGNIVWQWIAPSPWTDVTFSNGALLNN